LDLMASPSSTPATSSFVESPPTRTAPDEYVEIDSIATRCGVIAGLICEIDAGGFVRSFGR